MDNNDRCSPNTVVEESLWRNSSATYGLIGVLFHWTIALLFVAQLLLGYFMSGEDIDPALQFNLFQYHKSIGFVVLALAIPRVLWSLISKKPHPTAVVSSMARMSARIAHITLMILTVAVPLAGWAVASTSPLQIPSYVFDLVVIPGLPLPVSDSSEAMWTDVHQTLAYLAAVIVLLHVTAALWHHIVLKDATLKRMYPYHRRK